MRKLYEPQLPIMLGDRSHSRAVELQKISEVLDVLTKNGQLQRAYADLTTHRKPVRADLGRDAMTAEQVVRAVVLKQMFGLSYDALSFFLGDSLAMRAFCRLSAYEAAPKKSSLQSNISAISPVTLEEINKAVVRHAIGKKIENGRDMRADATVVQSNIHEPTDSALLWDGVRVLTRILEKAHEDFATTRCNQTRRAKRRSVGILNAGTEQRRLPLYKDLLKVTRSTCEVARQAVIALDAVADLKAMAYTIQLRHFLKLVDNVIEQTERRVLRNEQVPASEKIVSIFEPHTDIIKKARRETHYGHKVTLCTGRSGLVLDVVVEQGNPADSNLALRSVERHKALFGKAPERVVFDGGFASKQNLLDIKAAGSIEVCFSKAPGVPMEQMTSTPRIRNVLKRFRAGIEAGISFLKRTFGWIRVTWSGWPHFQSYIWASTVAHNLLTVARALIAKQSSA